MLYSILSASAILFAAIKAQGPVAQPPVNAAPQQPTQVTPQQPPATPQFGYQQPAPFNPVMPFNPGFMGGMVDPQNLKCEFGQCVNRRISLTPGQGFKLECQRPGVCNGLDLTLNVGIDPTNFGNTVNEINDLTFDAPQRDVKVRIQGGFGNNIEVNNIHCKVFGACTNLQVTTGFNVEAWNIEVHCDQPGACNGCTVNGMPCVQLAMMNGNNNGFGYFGGFGYQNQPNLPVAPQGPPQYPGPQQPPQPALPQYPPQGYPNPMWI